MHDAMTKASCAQQDRALASINFMQSFPKRFWSVAPHTRGQLMTPYNDSAEIIKNDLFKFSIKESLASFSCKGASFQRFYAIVRANKICITYEKLAMSSANRIGKQDLKIRRNGNDLKCLCIGHLELYPLQGPRSGALRK